LLNFGVSPLGFLTAGPDWLGMTMIGKFLLYGIWPNPDVMIDSLGFTRAGLESYFI
jgi:hypothetical protein